MSLKKLLKENVTMETHENIFKNIKSIFIWKLILLLGIKTYAKNYKKLKRL